MDKYSTKSQTMSDMLHKISRELTAIGVSDPDGEIKQSEDHIAKL